MAREKQKSDTSDFWLSKTVSSLVFSLRFNLIPLQLKTSDSDSGGGITTALGLTVMCRISKQPELSKYSAGTQYLHVTNSSFDSLPTRVILIYLGKSTFLIEIHAFGQRMPMQCAVINLSLWGWQTYCIRQKITCLTASGQLVTTPASLGRDW